MKEEQLQQLRKYREEGFGYKRIANLMKVSVDTVKYSCRKLEKAMTKEVSYDKSKCKECNGILMQPKKQKRIKFCSATCRQHWWSKNRNKQSGVEVICPTCQKKFYTTKQSTRKYCSHACYVKQRFGGGEYGKYEE